MTYLEKTLTAASSNIYTGLNLKVQGQQQSDSAPISLWLVYILLCTLMHTFRDDQFYCQNIGNIQMKICISFYIQRIYRKARYFLLSLSFLLQVA